LSSHALEKRSGIGQVEVELIRKWSCRDLVWSG